MTVEYTEAVSKDICARYVEAKEAGATYDERAALIRELAGELTVKLETEVTENSVRGKLVSMKVYEGKAKK